MKVLYQDVGLLHTNRYFVYLRMQDVHDRAEMEVWLKTMTPGAEVVTYRTSSTVRMNELAIYCDSRDASRIKLIL